MLQGPLKVRRLVATSGVLSKVVRTYPAEEPMVAFEDTTNIYLAQYLKVKRNAIYLWWVFRTHGTALIEVKAIVTKTTTPMASTDGATVARFRNSSTRLYISHPMADTEHPE